MTSRWGPALVGGLLIGVFVALGVVVSGAPNGLDVAVADALGGGWQGTPGRVATAIDVVLGPALPWAFTVVVIGFGIWRRSPDTTWLLVRCLVLMWLCRTVSAVKPLYRRERPRAYPDYSYPSGHVVSVACVAVAAVVLSRWLVPRLTRWVLAVSAAAVLVTMITRVVLDVHWCTDVLGAAIGVTGLGLVAAVALRLLPVRESPGVASDP